MLSNKFCGTLLHQRIDSVLIKLRFDHVRFLSSRESLFSFFELARPTTESSQVNRGLMISLEINFELLWHPVVKDDPFQADG